MPMLQDHDLIPLLVKQGDILIQYFPVARNADLRQLAAQLTGRERMQLVRFTAKNLQNLHQLHLSLILTSIHKPLRIIESSYPT